MGGACCVAARDKTIQHGSRSDILLRNVRYSPSWSFRWDNRGRVAGEETSINWLPDGIGRSDVLDIKSTAGVSAQASDGGSSLENYTTGSLCKSPINEATVRSLRPSASGKSISTDMSVEVKDSIKSAYVSYTAAVKLSPSAHSTPSVSMSPLSSQSRLPTSTMTPSRWVYPSPSHSSGRNSPGIISISEERQVSYSLPAGGNESTRASHGKSSDGWSLLAFSELLSTSHREMLSFDSESSSLTRDNKITCSNYQNSGYVAYDMLTCGVCSKLLTEKSAWSSQKIIASNELSMVAVLICGHVYHAECLENITPETNKYDPACPVCTLGEKQALILSGKVLKAERDLKVRSYKKSKNGMLGADNSIGFDYWKDNGGKDSKMSSSSSLKSSSGKRFLGRYFTFGSKRAKSTSETTSFKRNGLFCSKSSKE
ncbi:hypothetical protein Nepgr_004620 [Nepenthes gracilis]|uniref:RING-type domain-containing protein n=1 Tax=Nepenthes gracilis TaxID=150966 RepID=A0AAD3S267_NEPGR|nr:hypothetical protein Nepgr_004620 [Nepenthes gracilis]